MLNAGELGRLFSLIEAHVPVNDFRVASDYLWPILRLHLGWALRDDTAYGPGRPPAVQALCQRIDAAFAALPLRPTPPGDEALAPLWPVARQPADGVAAGGTVLFATMAQHHTRDAGGRFYHAMLDPWVELAGERGRAIKLEIPDDEAESLNKTPRVHPTSLISARNLDLRLSLREKAEFRSLFHVVHTWLSQTLGLNTADREDNFLFGYALMRAMARRWGDYLDSLRPDAVMLICWYSANMLGLCWAARERGLPAVDVQHGVISGAHFGYTDWTCIPPDGYRQMPSTFLLWGNDGARAMAPTLTGGGIDGPIRLRVGGRHGLLRADLPPETRSMVAALEPRLTQAGKVILYTAQTIDGTRLPDIILHAMAKAPPDWLWLIRAHPRAESEGLLDLTEAAITQRMQAAGLSNYECRAAVHLPLGWLLARADHMVTGFSSAVLEALGMKVPGTCHHPAALNYHADAIAAGKIAYADTADALVETIRQGAAALPGFQRGTRDMAVDMDLARAALADILAPAAGR